MLFDEFPLYLFYSSKQMVQTKQIIGLIYDRETLTLYYSKTCISSIITLMSIIRMMSLSFEDVLTFRVLESI